MNDLTLSFADMNIQSVINYIFVLSSFFSIAEDIMILPWWLNYLCCQLGTCRDCGSIYISSETFEKKSSYFAKALHLYFLKSPPSILESIPHNSDSILLSNPKDNGTQQS